MLRIVLPVVAPAPIDIVYVVAIDIGISVEVIIDVDVDVVVSPSATIAPTPTSPGCSDRNANAERRSRSRPLRLPSGMAGNRSADKDRWAGRKPPSGCTRARKLPAGWTAQSRRRFCFLPPSSLPSSVHWTSDSQPSSAFIRMRCTASITSACWARKALPRSVVHLMLSAICLTTSGSAAID